MGLTLSLSPVAEPARLATMAKAPLDAMSSTMGRTPAVMSRFVYSTLDPSIERTEMRLSSRRETSAVRSEEHTSELQSQSNLVCRLLLEKKNTSAAKLFTTSSDYGLVR